MSEAPACPKCGSRDGFYFYKWICYEQHADFAGEPKYAEITASDKYMKTMRCTSCNGNITAYVNGLNLVVSGYPTLTAR